MKKLLKISAISAALLSAPMMANADVLASVKPLGFIVSSIADGVTGTQVLVPAGASPHDYNLKLSDIQKVKSADLVVWIGEDIDSFLDKPISQIERKKVITIADLADVKPLLSKAHHEHFHEDGDHDHDYKHEHKHDHKHDHDHKHEHKHDHEHHDHDHHEGLTTNWHVWYSPAISKIVAQKVADKLTAQFPDKKALIAQNLSDFNRTLAEQSEKITAQLANVKDKGFYVFHDAYGYFNDAYGLKQTGYFTINPLVAPGAKTLAHIKEEIDEHKVNCLFAEPQFTPKVIESLAKNTKVNVGQLDPIGDKVTLGKNSYATFLQSTADSYMECLAK
ncbi:High-affinity zinc uptake system protein ZnuA precursor [Haemophilus influenzae]|uniref:zinc ABC transporter substrate-binding protein ZnuA n=1 Tax=Haemophilus influenzae TaxID=727 RepID=UPI0001A3F8D4|nr:zinc ABC transporter substrate-binding protein ZnuA [Haemophilus influenzae]AVI95273.1 high-affinity zinc uptake system protein znuA [Haemophilus influenzae]AVI97046.1 high-affinity zinc uptake system protein znuA [Haemophilus influenzae]AVJ06005.1 high-affinity zinc uptake system protein znuA [Haemophilus influenzae]AVJ07838.1 high-affinity zinc uptake system protein znuA [Haemophilus influenzae]EEP45508.1 high-affinity zinc transporter periplasmic component [Haemophilus influenzae 7P49H1]